MAHIDYDTGKSGKPIKVSDPSQKVKIGLFIGFGVYFVIWSILMLYK